MRRGALRLLAASFVLGGAAAAQAQTFAPPDVARLILNERGGVRDAFGWGEDILGALADNKLPANRENICSVIAVASQESGFEANPAVPGLGRIAEAALRKRASVVPLLGNKAIDYLDTVPDAKNSFLRRIRAARTERDLDLAYRAFVEYAAGKSALDGMLHLGLFDSWVEEFNQVSTVGSMQVSVAFAQETERGEHWRPLSHAETTAIRDKLYSRRGGLYFGARQLLGYATGYGQKIFRFADYNSGRYSARNAAFQSAVARLTGHKLAADGDLLAYGKGRKVSTEVTSSETALRALIAHYRLDIDDAALRRDLMREKSQDFTETKTFHAVRDLYHRQFKAEAPFAQLPGIELKSAKIKSRMTTALFAQSVNRRYGKCMALALQMENRPVLMAPKFWPD